jgi:hypothetical protein
MVHTPMPHFAVHTPWGCCVQRAGVRGGRHAAAAHGKQTAAAACVLQRLHAVVRIHNTGATRPAHLAAARCQEGATTPPALPCPASGLVLLPGSVPYTV